MYAGAAKCDISKGWCAGKVSITKSTVVSGKQEKTYLNFAFDIPGDCNQKEYHIWLSSKPISKPGFSGWYKTDSIDVTSLLKARTVYFAVHSSICCGDTCDGCTYSPANKGVPCSGTFGAMTLAAEALETSLAESIAEPEAEEPIELTIACPSDMADVCADEGQGYATIADIGSASASDPEAKITSDSPADGLHPIGETAVTWTATDAAGSTATCQQYISVQDCEIAEETSELSITCPDTLEVCAEAGKDYATIKDIGAATANDPEAKITSDAPKDNKYSIGETVVTWTAADAAGNTTACQQSITVKETAACNMTAAAPSEV